MSSESTAQESSRLGDLGAHRFKRSNPVIVAAYASLPHPMPKGDITWLSSTTMSFPTSKHQSQGYLPVSTLEENVSSPHPRPDLEAPPKYAHFEDVEEQEEVSVGPQKQRESWKKSLGTGLLVASVVYFIVWGFRGAFGKLGSPGCRGKHALPTSYTLPSGDKIPSVALGALHSSWILRPEFSVY